MDLKEKIKFSIEREKKIIHNFETQKDYADWHLAALSKLYADLGFYFFIDSDILMSKKSLSIVGMIDIYLTEKYFKSHSRFLDFDISRSLLPLLSDNEPLTNVMQNCAITQHT